MRRIAFLAAAISVAVTLVGCSGAVSVKPGAKKPLADPWPTAEPLSGSFPIGRWACFDAGIDYEALKRANDRRTFDPRCFYIWITASIGKDRSVSLLPDSTGWVIRHGEPSRASGSGWFRLAGSDLLYQRTDDFRWEYAEGTLTVQHTDHETYTVESVQADWFLITRDRYRNATQYMMVRIGTSFYQELVAFGECVRSNYDKKLFEVVECSVPSP